MLFLSASLPGLSLSLGGGPEEGVLGSSERMTQNQSWGQACILLLSTDTPALANSKINSKNSRLSNQSQKSC